MIKPFLLTEIFPLSKKKSIKATRRIAREKALQIIYATTLSDLPWEVIFEHIHIREFNFGDEEVHLDKILTQDEIVELESDIPILWSDEETSFCKELIISSLSLNDEIETILVEIAENWEYDRIAIIDKILIGIATAEFIKFPEIPTKVSINEAIDIAKSFSTDKSGYFINGVLDKILEQLIKDGRINKTGRGLNTK